MLYGLIHFWCFCRCTANGNVEWVVCDLWLKLSSPHKMDCFYQEFSPLFSTENSVTLKVEGGVMKVVWCWKAEIRVFWIECGILCEFKQGLLCRKGSSFMSKGWWWDFRCLYFVWNTPGPLYECVWIINSGAIFKYLLSVECCAQSCSFSQWNLQKFSL